MPKVKDPKFEDLRRKAQAELDEEIAQLRKHRTRAQIILGEAVTDAAGGIVDALKHKDPKIRFEAQKHLLKLNGLEVVKVEHGGVDGKPLTLVIKRYSRKNNRTDGQAD